MNLTINNNLKTSYRNNIAKQTPVFKGKQVNLTDVFQSCLDTKKKNAIISNLVNKYGIKAKEAERITGQFFKTKEYDELSANKFTNFFSANGYFTPDIFRSKASPERIILNLAYELLPWYEYSASYESGIDSFSLKKIAKYLPMGFNPVEATVIKEEGLNKQEIKDYLDCSQKRSVQEVWQKLKRSKDGSKQRFFADNLLEASINHAFKTLPCEQIAYNGISLKSGLLRPLNEKEITSLIGSGIKFSEITKDVINHWIYLRDMKKEKCSIKDARASFLKDEAKDFKTYLYLTKRLISDKTAFEIAQEEINQEIILNNFDIFSRILSRKITPKEKESALREMLSLYQSSFQYQKKASSKKAFRDFINKEGKVTKEDFQTFSKQHPECIELMHQTVLKRRENEITKDYFPRTAPKTIAKIALIFKEFFDKYFDGNYKILSIGTSPSIISEALQSLGADVTYMPISNLRGYNSPTPAFFRQFNSRPTTSEANVLTALKYVSKNGVNRHSKKPIILFDYVENGGTIQAIYDYIQTYNNVSKEKLVKCSIIDYLKDYCKKERRKYHLTNEEIETLYYDFLNSKTECISNTPHFYNCTDSFQSKSYIVKSEDKTNKEVFKEFEEYSQSDARIFSFCVLDELEKMK